MIECWAVIIFHGDMGDKERHTHSVRVVAGGWDWTTQKLHYNPNLVLAFSMSFTAASDYSIKVPRHLYDHELLKCSPDDGPTDS